jgi:hypothetical protein
MRFTAKTVTTGVALAACVAGCSTMGTATSVSPISSAFLQPVAVRVPENMGSEDLLNLPSGALTSEVALLKSSSDEVCFDIKMRTWQGSVRRWNATLEVDGRELVQGAAKYSFRWALVAKPEVSSAVGVARAF